MNGKRNIFKLSTLGILLICYSISVCDLHAQAPGQRADQTPNLIIIFTDDQGYGDLSSYGHPEIETPNIDRLAEEGMKFTDFYVPAPVCTPSRAALLTGTYPKRVGLAHRVLFPYSKTGLNPDEITIAEMLKDEGYATAAIGKWHLGHYAPFLPTNQGFDYYFGIPYSNDMGDVDYDRYNMAEDYVSGPIPVYRNEEVIEVDPDQSRLTRRYTDEAIRFVTENRDQPFFLYLPHSMPHVPIAASRHFRGKSDYGTYGDAIEEIDWGVGEILDHLEHLGIARNTVVMFATDNGASEWEGQGGWVWTPEWDGRVTRGTQTYRSGSNGPLRGDKNTTWEGGMRVPFLIRWPERIPAGEVSGALVTSMDILPTIAGILGIELPADRKIDGYDIWPILSGTQKDESPYQAFYYYRDDRLQAVRSGRWKLHVYRPDSGATEMLYNLQTDIGETTDVSDEHPDVVERLQRLAEEARRDLGDAATGREGSNVRPIGKIE
ncbi:sulfatase [Halalkalibaculum sp. DA3122]|uniref:sulfatase family protein n=1 Tax=Halalkalibaculum sp. DA3122 TaxID=3373607 RepID=UPI00375416C9